MSVCLYFSLLTCFSVSVYICLAVSDYVSLCLPVCLLVYHVSTCLSLCNNLCLLPTYIQHVRIKVHVACLHTCCTRGSIQLVYHNYVHSNVLHFAICLIDSYRYPPTFAVTTNHKTTPLGHTCVLSFYFCFLLIVIHK